ncbi:hypothetical protein [Smaragdicoccus niigatensis]|uniref:hypothetical protein n=1 Tax=Smaragdicoccus niigatensis TaxID=359359 RepID=UPI00036770AC|nr:hypothetical protein [Smaragdicoccus niigatensis]
MDHLAPRHEQVQLTGGFAINEWIAVGLGSGVAAVGLGILTGSAMLGIAVGVAFLAATWAILLLI